MLRLSFVFCCIILCSCSPNNSVVPVVPDAPSGLDVYIASNHQLDLSWTDHAANEAGFIIQRKTSGGSYENIDSTGANITAYSDTNVLINTTYVYRVSAFNATGNSNQYSNEDSAMIIVNTIMLPEVNTLSASGIDTMNAVLSGEVINDGGAAVTVRGICWGSNLNPTITAGNVTTEGSGLGNFSSSLSSLSPNTTYHFRAYATISAGTAYGNDMAFTTQPLPVVLAFVTIGSQKWSLKNLDVDHYLNGDPIPQITDPVAWRDATEGAWCWYNNDSATNAAKYGKLYNWYAVNDPRGLAPAGWHIPNDLEWKTLMRFLDSNADTSCNNCNASLTAGGTMKPIGYVFWFSPNTGATNSSGFTAMPAGYRTEIGNFSLAGHTANWWSASDYDPYLAFFYYDYYTNTITYRAHNDKHYGNSVRLIKN